VSKLVQAKGSEKRSIQARGGRGEEEEKGEEEETEGEDLGQGSPASILLNTFPTKVVLANFSWKSFLRKSQPWILMKNFPTTF